MTRPRELSDPGRPYSPNGTKPRNDNHCDPVVVARRLNGQPTRQLSRAENLAVVERMKANGVARQVIADLLGLNNSAYKSLMEELEGAVA